MQDSPNAIDLLQSVTAFLRNAAIPRLSGREAFDARVAANVLDIVERELRLAPDTAAAERDSLRQLLGTDGDLEALNRQLCEAIAAGHIDLETPGLATHLWTVTLNKLAIDQPAYSSYRAALQAMEQ
ncbi:DUF6285 domain-containing protein [Cupriavidus basilensis]